MTPELLAPAGNLEKLETALRYGADAVYCGIEQFSLRALAGNLTLDELSEACKITHTLNKRLYLTLNVYLRPGEETSARKLLQELLDVPVDAYIISDPGMLQLVREIDPNRELHLSTQANTTSGLAAQFWQQQGVKRLNLARELSLQEIADVRKSSDIELEAFVHGAMCMAYSGRCLLSAELSGRSANSGECSHSCRWKYSLQEETRPGEFFPVEEDERGTYIMNSRDLCLIEHLPKLVGAGVNSLKIEGRMKSLFYVAVVVRAYRAALDAWQQSPQDFKFDPLWRSELDAVSHRPYGTGFLFADDDAFVHAEDSSYVRDCDFVGIVREGAGDGRCLVEGRNRFQAGDTLELIGPAMKLESFAFSQAQKQGGEVLTTVQPNAMVTMALPAGAQVGDLLRRWREPAK